MPRLILAFLLSSTALFSSAQDTAAHATPDKVFYKTEVSAQYPGGSAAFDKFNRKHLKYPKEANEKEIQGVVVVQFIVDSAGNVSDVHAISGPTIGGLREEAVRIITISGKWIPALQNGYKVSSIVKQPMVFRLNYN